jgi:glycosyltransferase involved in cell wall biosynthesis
VTLASICGPLFVRKVSVVRLLFLTPQLPLPPHTGITKGTTLRNFGLLDGLAARHEIHLLSFSSPGTGYDAALALQDVCTSVQFVPEPVRGVRDRIWAALTSSLPDLAHRLASPSFARALQNVLEGQCFDVIQFEGLEMAPYLAQVLEHVDQKGARPHLVLDEHNAEYVLQRRVFEMDVRRPRRWPSAVYSLAQWFKLERFEAWACRHVDSVVAVSEADARALGRIASGVHLSVVPNGLDVQSYADAESVEALPPQSLVFTGTMDYRPNVDAVLWFAQHVYPLIQRRAPGVRFYVVGRRPHSRLDPLRQQPGIEITGDVPDTRPVIRAASAYVIPLLSGGGTRFKVLEAMAMRCPIVSTSMGCDGFPVVSGRDVLLADEPEAFAEKVVDLLGDERLRRELGKAGLEFARRYDWSEIVPMLDEVYWRIAKGERLSE